MRWTVRLPAGKRAGVSGKGREKRGEVMVSHQLHEEEKKGGKVVNLQPVRGKSSGREKEAYPGERKKGPLLLHCHIVRKKGEKGRESRRKFGAPFLANFTINPVSRGGGERREGEDCFTYHVGGKRKKVAICVVTDFFLVGGGEKREG